VAGQPYSAIAPLERSPTRLSRETFSVVFSLTESQPWLKERQTSLIELIDECDLAEQQLLLCELLQRFLCLDEIAYKDSLKKIVEYIENTLALTPDDTVICARENSSYSDSSQRVAYDLKCTSWKSPLWDTTSFVNRLRDVVSANQKRHIILVDEFIGTGDSFKKSVNWLKCPVRRDLKMVSLSSPSQ